MDGVLAAWEGIPLLDPMTFKPFALILRLSGTLIKICPCCRPKCQRGHSYESVIKDRVKRGLGCPYCSGKRAFPGENDLQTLRHEIAAEWHSGKNELRANEVRPGSGKKVWWLCACCGHEWQARISDRTIRGSGCPVCALKKTKGYKKRMETERK